MTGNRALLTCMGEEGEDSMREITLRRWHGRVGAILAFFFVLQGASGMALGWSRAQKSSFFSWLVTGATSTPLSEEVLRQVHSGTHEFGLLYNLFLGLGLIWMAASGAAIYLRCRNRRGPPPP